MAIFLHGHAYDVSLYYPMSIMAVDPVCPQAILPMRVTLFSSGTLCMGADTGWGGGTGETRPPGQKVEGGPSEIAIV